MLVVPEAEAVAPMLELGPNAAPAPKGVVEDSLETMPAWGKSPLPSRAEKEAEATGATLRSILDRGKWAERQLSQVCLPKIQQSLLQYRSADFFRDAYASILWATNSFASLKTVLAQADLALIASQGEVEAIRARLLEVERAIASQSEVEAVRAHLGEVEKDLEEAIASEGRARRALEEAECRATLAEEKSHKAEERIKAAEEETLSQRARAQEAEERANRAEELVRQSDTRAGELSQEIRSLRERVEGEIRRGAVEVDRRVTEAVASIQESDAYKKDLAESSAHFYDLGFKDCKAKVKQVYGLEGVEDLEPDSADDSTPSTPQGDDVPPADP